MDNIPDSNPSEQNQNVSNLPFVVLLNSAQYALYKTASLEILAPDSEYLESIGHNILKDMAEMESHQLHNQIVLLENLLININHDINLPARAVTGLADVFCKVHDYLVKCPK